MQTPTAVERLRHDVGRLQQRCRPVLGDASLVGSAGRGSLRVMGRHVSVVFVEREAACLGLGGSMGGLLAHALTVHPWCAADVRACEWLGVWRRLQMPTVPAGGGTDDIARSLSRACACTDRGAIPVAISALRLPDRYFRLQKVRSPAYSRVRQSS